MSRRSLVIAHHQGPCADCPDLILVGDVITDTVDGWVHHQCADHETAAPAQGTDLCTECFTYRSLSGDCCCDPR